MCSTLSTLLIVGTFTYVVLRPLSDLFLWLWRLERRADVLGFTSAPLDDWWHRAYGLDVKILSPPHMVLAAGMMAVQNIALAATELGLGTHIKTGAVMSDPGARAAMGVREALVWEYAGAAEDVASLLRAAAPMTEPSR